MKTFRLSKLSGKLNFLNFLSISASKFSVLALFAGNMFSAILITSCKDSESSAQQDKQNLKLIGYEYNQRSLFKAATQDNVEVLKVFKENGFDLRTKDFLGRSAAHVAADSGAVRALDFLRKSGVDLEMQDNHGRTPLILAAKNNKLGVIEYLLDANALTQVRDEYKKFALLYAIEANSEEGVRLIAPHNRELLDTALLYAADQNKPNVIAVLVQFGASVYARSQGMTGLMIAAKKGNAEVIKELLEHGANPYAVSEDGKLAHDYAAENKETLAALAAITTSSNSDEELTLNWSDQELATIVNNATQRSNALEAKRLKKTAPLDQQRDKPTNAIAENATITRIQGKQLPLRIDSQEDLEEKLSMANYAEKPLPLLVHSEDVDKVEVQDLRNADSDFIGVQEGSEIGMTGLKVIQIEKKIVNSKATGGLDKELVTLTVQNEKTGQTREIYSGHDSAASDAIAVVRFNDTNEHWVVQRDDTFEDNNGTLFKVSDVNEREVVIENMETNEVTLLPLLGIQHQ